MKIRVGFGYDVHAFTHKRELWLGGIKVDYTMGLKGHSDADVLVHAICDALLGAANLRDIGYNFPDTDNTYKDIDSKVLLSKTMDLIRSKGFEFMNTDCTVCAEQPKLNSYIPKMQRALAEVMNVDIDDISIKATTTEKLGFVGKKEGIAAYATVLILKRGTNS
ncbi:MAG: 2-C-methyl-D-erythritol 2,4-cyclodiphosphate synthase [Paludibacteraceae bacterium]